MALGGGVPLDSHDIHTFDLAFLVAKPFKTLTQKIQVGAARSNFGDERYENPEMQAVIRGRGGVGTCGFSMVFFSMWHYLEDHPS